MEEKLTAYYKSASEEPDRMLEFRPQPMGYELTNDKVFIEVLCPQTISDLADYHLRECLKRYVRMRRCKNCGSVVAQKKRKECEAGKITAKEFGK